MLTAVLNEAEARARRVVAIADGAARSEPRDHARLVADQVVPDGRRISGEVVAFSNRSTDRIQQVLRLNDLATGRAELANIQRELADMSVRIFRLNADANAARAAIQYDLAKVDRDIADLRVRVSARTSEAVAAGEKARQRSARSAWTWLAGPLGKAIDELVGLIQDGSSTEATAKHALEELHRARDDVRHMEDAANSLTLLADCATDLTRGLQGLANTVAVVLGHAQNASEDLAEAHHLELFCRTAILDLDNLRQDSA